MASQDLTPTFFGASHAPPSARPPALDDYVEIVRHVRVLADDDGSERGGGVVRRLLQARRSQEKPTLASLLQPNSIGPIVLIAPSGTGKTIEFRHEARRLRGKGRHAVFVEALGVVGGSGIDLDEEERSALQNLLRAQSQEGTLFVDALDELRIRQRTVEELFRRLRREFDFVEHRIRLVFSARNGAWNPAATRELRRQLENVGAPSPTLIRFERLDRLAIAKLAEACGVDDVRAFMAEFESEELDDLLDLRPSDVKLLVHFRKQAGALKGWTRVLSDYVDASFIEERPDKSWARTLQVEQGRGGLRRVAAAALLMKVPHVSNPTVAAADGAISSRKLLADWSAAAVSELFENPLFVHKGREAEAVQLPQGKISDFLAAQWLADRAHSGSDEELLRQLLMVRVPWAERLEIPSAHRNVVGWVASEVPAFRRPLLREHPVVVLFEGDPDRLSDAEIREGLGYLCGGVFANVWDYWPTPAMLRRLARPALAADVNALLKQYRSTPSVLAQLLKWVEFGAYRECAEEVLALATTCSDGLVRTLAVGAVTAVAPEQRAELLSLLGDTDDYVRGALLQSLVPDVLHGEALVRFVLMQGGHAFRHALGEIAARISSSDLDSAIGALLPELASPTVTARTFDAFDVAIPLLVSRLDRNAPESPAIVGALIAMERLRHDHPQANFTDSEEHALVQLLDREHELRRQLWQRRFQEIQLSPMADHHVEHPAFGALRDEDIPWLWSIAEEQRLQRQTDARSVLQRHWGRLSEARRQVAIETVPAAVRGHLESMSHLEVEQQRRLRAHEEAQERKDAEQRRKNEEALSTERAAIESGKNIGALVWACNLMDGGGSERTRVSAVRLHRYVGAEYVEVLLRGMSVCWREMEIQVPEPGRSMPPEYAVALTGVAIAIRRGFELSTLSPSAAEKVARLALYELNAFPFWFGDLARTHTDAVRRALRDTLTLEWQHAEENHGVLRFAAYSDREVAQLMRAIVLDLLTVGPPSHPRTVHYAVDTILTSTLQTPRVAALVRGQLQGAESASSNADWLRLWAHVEPEVVADWFAGRARRDGDAVLPLFLKTAALLEQDLNHRTGRTAATGFTAPRALGRWAKLIFSLVRPEDDVKRKGVFSPGDRDHAQDLRHRCLSGLASNPSSEARVMLLELRSDPTFAAQHEFINQLLSDQHRAAVDAPGDQWTEEDFLRFERGDEKLPRALSELYKLVQTHLQHVHRLLANDDFSYRGLFTSATAEREIQLWVASCLRQRARGLYSVVRENVLDDDKEVDISAFAAGVGQIPIEIKPLGQYSATALERVVTDQLLRRYMQPPDRRYGVLLLVRRDHRTWRFAGKSIGFEALVDHVRGYAQEVSAKHGKEIHVSVIDLLPAPSPNTVREEKPRSGGSRHRRKQDRRIGKKKTRQSQYPPPTKKRRVGGRSNSRR